MGSIAELAVKLKGNVGRRISLTGLVCYLDNSRSMTYYSTSTSSNQIYMSRPKRVSKISSFITPRAPPWS